MSENTVIKNYCDSFSPGGVADRIAGMVFGHALGDAVGLTTEFCETRPAGIKFPYTDSIRKVKPCDWTDDTDLLVMTMGSLMENNMKLIHRELAGRFVYWIKKGLIYTGDTEPKTPNNTFKYIVSKPNYIDDPIGVAKKVAEESRGQLYNNSPLTRVAIAGTHPQGRTLAAELCSMTHTDTRCIAACIFFSCMINSLIYNSDLTSESFASEITIATDTAVSMLDPVHHDEFRNVISTALRGTLASFKLGEIARASSVYKCLSCIVYALRIVSVSLKSNKIPDFKLCIEKIAMECGDADANCAVAGAILGCAGYKKLPADWISAMPHSKSLSQFIAVYISRLFAPTTFEENANAEAANDRTDNLANELETGDVAIVPVNAPTNLQTHEESTPSSAASTSADNVD